jgi:hypothetical protein
MTDDYRTDLTAINRATLAGVKRRAAITGTNALLAR